jgi:hypothetical protein
LQTAVKIRDPALALVDVLVVEMAVADEHVVGEAWYVRHTTVCVREGGDANRQNSTMFDGA